MNAISDLDTQLRKRFDELLLFKDGARDMVTAEVDAEHLLEVCRVLHDDQALRFEQLSDICGMDYSTYGHTDWNTQSTTHTGYSRGVQPDARGTPKEETWGDADQEPSNEADQSHLAAIYHLLSLKHNRRLRLRCRAVGTPPRLPSVVTIWNSANWYEREAFDLFGILFTEHPDLRRLLTDYGFIGHPFRKDFPLHGKVEVRYDPDQERVVYQPVSIENRVLMPRVMRDDNRYLRNGEENTEEDAKA